MNEPPHGRLPRTVRELVLLGLVLLFAAAMFTFRLGAGSLWDLDESRYAQVSREILMTGDPVTMHLNGKPWFGPPPFWMWLQAVTGWAFGFSEFTTRAWAAIFGVLGVAATYTLGREWFGPRTGLLGGLILTTMLEYLLLSRLAVVDVVQAAFMLLALHAFYRGYRDRGSGDYLRGFLYSGLATLTRGPIALVLPALVLVLFLAARRALDRWREVPWGWGALLYLGVAAPWYVLETARSGSVFLSAAFGGESLGRLTRAAGAQAASVLYHVPVLILGAVPWTAFLPGALVYHSVRRWQDGSLICLQWCGVAFLLAVALGGRLPDGVFLIYPLAAIAVARLWEDFLFEGGRYLRRALVTSFILQIGVALFVAVAGAAFATVRYPREFAAVRGAFIPPLAALVVGPAVTAVLFRYRRYTAAFLALPATMAAFVGILYTITVPAVETQKPMKPLAAALKLELRPGDRIIGYRIGTPASLIYYTNHSVEPVGDPAVLRERLCDSGRVFLVTTREELATAHAELPPGLLQVADRGEIVVKVKPAALTCGGEA